MSAANNKVPGYPLEIFDFVSGSGSYIIFAAQVYHTATPYIISRQRYIIEKRSIMDADDSTILKQLVEQIIVGDDGIEVHFECGIVASHEYM